MYTAAFVAEKRGPVMIVQHMRSYFAGIDFPAHRQDLVRIARLSGATDDELRALQALPNRNFSGLSDIRQSLAFARRMERDHVVA